MSLLSNTGDSLWEGRVFSSPWPLLAVVGPYLYFVLQAGPRIMASRPAYSLRTVIAIYNLLLVIFSSWNFLKLHRLMKGHFFMAHCRPNTLSPEVHDEINDLTYLYFLSKLVELLDTVFFIIRKKMNQVSFLHVYHHTNMALTPWIFLQFVPGSQLAIITYSNTFVHILMYSYYFLAALGPAVQKYLWWKKYLTMIQIIQFIVIITFFTVLLLTPGCQVSKKFTTLAMCNTASFLILFLFFYAKEYSKKSKKVIDQKHN